MPDGTAAGKIKYFLTRKFTAKNFLQAVEFVNKVAPVAEAARHHPDIHLTNYRDVELVLFTHFSGRPTPDDFALASKLSRVGVAVSPKWAKENPARGAAEDGRRGVGRITKLALHSGTCAMPPSYLAGRLRGKACRSATRPESA